MSSKTISKLAVVVALLGVSFYFLYPNFVWYSLSLSERQTQAKRKDPLAQKAIPLGLDLQGGVHLVYQLDTSKLPDVAAETVTKAVEQNILVINNRVDALGVANPFVARQGNEFIVVQLPGVYESEAARNLIGKTALLSFHMVKDEEALVKIIGELDKAAVTPEQVAEGKIPDAVKKLVPAGLMIAPSRDGGYLLVTAEPALTGKYLKQARVEMGGGQMSLGGLSIGFELDPEGAKLFEALTSANIGQRLAIVLDNFVQSAPRIESRIPGGRGQITGTFSPQEAKNLAHVLNSGNLQAPMSVVEERSVGPELGEDSIKGGFRGMAIGYLLVVIFISVYYRLSGVLANFALVLNFIFTVAAMTYMKATLTLPGIAGLILSIAMAVDANVIILERVREELKKGKDVKMAIREGYDKAFSAILDGNLTTMLAAAFLFQFGTGPIKGFGITLMLGLGVSMFTAVWVTRACYEAWLETAKPKTLSV